MDFTVTPRIGIMDFDVKAKLTVTVKYSCPSCGLIKREVAVACRESPKDDVAAWVTNVVGSAVGRDHAKASPFCQATSMRNLMIPLPPGESDGWIGGPTVQ